MTKNKSQSGSSHLIIVLILSFALLVSMGFVFYQNFIAKKDNASNSTVVNNQPTSVSQSLSNDTYQIYVYNKEQKTINGDSCNIVSVLTLFTSNSRAVLSDSSCLDTEVKIGTYGTSSSTISISFTKLIDGSTETDLSSNPATFTMDNNGTANSSLFTESLTYTKK